ncbi:MAG: polysaccharide deacetylase family protein [Candidatus Aenigmatarchaeota archaeon]
MTKELKLLIFSFMIILGTASIALAAPSYSSNAANTVVTVEGNYTVLSVFWNSTEPLSTAVLSTNETGVWIEYVKPIEYTEELVPILYYHGIGETYPSPYNTKVSDFISHMDYLYKNNYNTITFAELLEYMNSNKKLPEKAVVITFDDGWKDQYDNAFPILKRYGFTATFFIITNYTINNNYYPGYMGIADVQALHAGGMDIACHSKTHPIGGLNLTANPGLNLSLEINESKNDICGWLDGDCPKVFAYPEGVFDDSIIEWVKGNDFIGARAIEKDGVGEGWIEPRFAWLKASNDEESKFTIGSNIIDANTTFNGSSAVSFEKLVNYTKRNEFEDMYVTVSDLDINGNISLEDQFEADSFSSIALPDAGDSVTVGVLIPSTDRYNITFRVLTGGMNLTDPSSYSPLSNTYAYYIDNTQYTLPTAQNFVNDTHTVLGDDNVTVWGYVWGSQILWNIQIDVGFHNITVVAQNNWSMLDYFTIDYSNKVINASNYYNSPRFPRTYEAWTNFTWRNDSVPFGKVVGWKVFANDTSGNGNTTETFSFNFIPVNKSLSWSNSQAQLVNSYTPSGYSNFSITWSNNTSSLSGAYIENNFTGSLVNTSMNGTYPNYYYNTTPMAAGTYQYRFVANDSNNSQNATQTLMFTINKAVNPTDLYFNNGTEYMNQNVDIVYATPINVTGMCTVGACNLYRNDTGISENNTEVTLGAGTWQYTLNTTGNQNYSTNFSKEYNITVTKADNPVYLYLNGTNNTNVTYTYPEAINATAMSAFGTAYLYRDETQIVNAIEQVLLGNGTYTYKVNATGNANYSSNATGVKYYAFVNKGVLSLSISFNPSDTVILGSQALVAGIENNVGDVDVFYEFRRDGFLIGNVTGNVSYSVNETNGELGKHNYNFNASGGANWTANFDGIWSLLTVQVPSNSLPSGGGGGGGGGYVPPVTTKDDEDNADTNETTTEEPEEELISTEEPCIEEWICSGWSACREGSQIRTCVDSNECGTEPDTSMEFMECDDQSQATGLFSVFTTPIGLAVVAIMAMPVTFMAFRIIRNKKQNKIDNKKVTKKKK